MPKISNRGIFSSRIEAIQESATLALTTRAMMLKQKGEDVVMLTAGEPDLDTPEHIKQAGIRAIIEGHTRYTDPAGILSLREAVARKFKEEYGVEYTAQQILITPGAKKAIFDALLSILNPGDQVIIFAPYWTSYPEMVKISGARPVIVDTSKTKFHIQVEQVRKKLSRKTKAIIINNPNNPTGVIIDKHNLLELANVAVSNEVFIISDEIYEKIIFDEVEFCCMASLGEEIKNRTIVINGVSKTYAMTGWRIGYAAGPQEIIQRMVKLQSQSVSCPCSISQYAALEALTASQSFVKDMVKQYQNCRDLVYNSLKEIQGIGIYKPQGAFYIFPKVSGFYKKGDNSFSFCERLLNEQKVAVIPGAAFGNDEHIRISFAASEEDLIKGIERIKKFLLSQHYA